MQCSSTAVSMLNRQTPCAYACLHTQRTCLLVHAYMLACACVHADSRPSSGCMGHGTHSKMAFTYTDTLSASGPCTHKVHARIQRYTCTLSPHICQAALELAMRKSSASNGTNGSTPPPVNKLPPPPGGHYCRGHKEHCLCHKEHCLSWGYNTVLVTKSIVCVKKSTVLVAKSTVCVTKSTVSVATSTGLNIVCLGV
jgi:hypothetical protein